MTPTEEIRTCKPEEDERFDTPEEIVAEFGEAALEERP